MARKRIGWSAGLTFFKEGGVVMPGGNCGAAVAMAACTSWAAASMLRFRANCKVTCVTPRADVEFIESNPAIVENCLSRGVAQAEAIVSGLAPGTLAVTRMVGKSTLGRSFTASIL